MLSPALPANPRGVDAAIILSVLNPISTPHHHLFFFFFSPTPEELKRLEKEKGVLLQKVGRGKGGGVVVCEKSS